jgi:hypothetical protein
MRRIKWTFSHPKFKKRAAFKTFLKRHGFKVSRDFYGKGCCIAKKGSRLFRFHFGTTWDVDVSCPSADFDRWANSTDAVIPIEEFTWLIQGKGLAVVIAKATGG